MPLTGPDKFGFVRNQVKLTEPSDYLEFGREKEVRASIYVAVNKDGL